MANRVEFEEFSASWFRRLFARLWNKNFEHSKINNAAGWVDALSLSHNQNNRFFDEHMQLNMNLI